MVLTRKVVSASFQLAVSFGDGSRCLDQWLVVRESIKHVNGEPEISVLFSTNVAGFLNITPCKRHSSELHIL